MCAILQYLIKLRAELPPEVMVLVSTGARSNCLLYHASGLKFRLNTLWQQRLPTTPGLAAPADHTTRAHTPLTTTRAMMLRYKEELLIMCLYLRSLVPKSISRSGMRSWALWLDIVWGPQWSWEVLSSAQYYCHTTDWFIIIRMGLKVYVSTVSSNLEVSNKFFD